ncbi:MAG: ribonuclease HII [Oscillibacter sp.]|jgi:ribonuclease HII|nr:ribonuclease HII [Oscillibacter sp.]
MHELEHPWTLEEAAFDAGFETVCGTDEAGAGPLAGPVYAAAVVLPRGLIIDGLNDSKKLSPKKRDELYGVICADAISFAVASASVAEIEKLNILNARMLAMSRAIEGLNIPPDYVLIDGNRDCGGQCHVTDLHHETVIGGDGKSASIAAASILAKVSRDRYVCEVLGREYPEYQFAKHKGYGTKLHYEMLDKYGPCPEHRMSFLKKWEERK